LNWRPPASTPQLTFVRDSADKHTRAVELRIPVVEGHRYMTGAFTFDGNAFIKNDALRLMFKIERSTLGKFRCYREDFEMMAAVERKHKLLLSSEAAVRLGEEGPALCPGLPWEHVRGIGNWLRHQYDRVDVQTVYRTVRQDLPALKPGVQRALSVSMKPDGPSPW
jgi:uncharacterized protein with HEPN domain